MRFYELQGGRITIDGVNIRDMNRKELRSILGMVLQDTWLFNGTIAENIAYGYEDASMEEIIGLRRRPESIILSVLCPRDIRPF